MSSMTNTQWVRRIDRCGAHYWVNILTGEATYAPPIVSNGVPMATCMQSVMMGWVPPPRPLMVTPPTGFPQYVPPMFQGTCNPGLHIGTWERKYDGDGGKYWVNSLTGQMSLMDPWK